MHERLTDRFWSKVQKSDGCWLWTAGRLGKYGGIGVGGHHRLAHRISWEITHGQRIPERLYVLHSCDNTLCVRPDHLRVGTHSENLQDSWDRTRNISHKGEQNPNGRLSDADVAAIRAAPKRYGLRRALARQYGVSEEHIWRIRTGRSHG